MKKRLGCFELSMLRSIQNGGQPDTGPTLRRLLDTGLVQYVGSRVEPTPLGDGINTDAKTYYQDPQTTNHQKESQMLIFLDTETSGLPRSWNAPATDTENWPHMVQLAYIVTTDDGQELDRHETVIKPEGYTIPDEVARIHGITTAIALEQGRDLAEVLARLAYILDLHKVKTMVCHNTGFDEKIVGSAYHRIGAPDAVQALAKRCTMKEATRFCALPRNKWPKLQELHQILFKEAFADAHSALADVEACRRCFFELRKREVIR